MADPSGTVEQTYRALGIAWPGGLADAIRTHLAERPKGARGVHEYSLAEMGLDAATERARFTRYQSTYGVPAEV